MLLYNKTLFILHSDFKVTNLTKKTGLRHLLAATKYSFQGLLNAFKNESAFRQELFLCLFAVPIAILCARSFVEAALLVGSCFAILVVELLNTAIERVVDRIGLEEHPLSGQAKDLGSSAVMLTTVFAALVWVVFVYDYLFDLYFEGF